MPALSDKEALARIIGKRLETSTAELARDWRWSAAKVRHRLAKWSSAGHIEVKPGLGGRTVIAVPEPVAAPPTSGPVASMVAVSEPVASAPAGRIPTPLAPEPVAAKAPGP